MMIAQMIIANHGLSAMLVPARDLTEFPESKIH
jgi:hypothetical protein